MVNFYNERAQLLYDKSKANGVLEKVYEDLQLFKQGVGGEMPFTQMMTREYVTNSSKGALLKDIIVYFHEETKQFFQYFIDEALYSYIYRTIKQFEDIYAKHHLTIVTAVPLSKEQVERIKRAMALKKEQEFDTCENQVDERILGGVLVKSKEFIYDTTLATQLKEFKKEFSEG
ncbi:MULTISPECIES: ATP synthase F1 subunit delta [unclassified Granulicatella]|uniref:ATP synthase F1 subunit delta n=1 Tax=unclassified Granulicatella TaxID=2630493 RepID=UPI001073EC2D|nr:MULTISPECIES: ATP synthase F1 subunit delta [unclassified Granulicatella]MBF0780856.1 ATP synthase F1 subunit delta [Granulicatella sp. 19428wC4_WM01]TFU93494.1 ATP synthase F1 subunit delta [Granulicatella sp. WM01]